MRGSRYLGPADANTLFPSSELSPNLINIYKSIPKSTIPFFISLPILVLSQLYINIFIRLSSSNTKFRVALTFNKDCNVFIAFSIPLTKMSLLPIKLYFFSSSSKLFRSKNILKSLNPSESRLLLDFILSLFKGTILFKDTEIGLKLSLPHLYKALELSKAWLQKIAAKQSIK